MFQNEQFNFLINELNKLLVSYAPKLLLAFLVLIVGFWLIRKLYNFLIKILKEKNLDSTLISFFGNFTKILLQILLLITVADIVGIHTFSVVTIMGAAGLGIGLSLQGSLSNFAGGVLIVIFKPYKVNDIVNMQGVLGTVSEIQIFNTLLITPENKVAILPNGAIANGNIINHSKLGFIYTTTSIVLAFDIDYENFKLLVVAELNKINGIKLENGVVFEIDKLHENTMTVNIEFAIDATLYDDTIVHINEIVRKVILQNNIQRPINSLKVIQ